MPPFSCLLKTAEVPDGSIRAMEDGRGGFDWLGNSGDKAGIHLYWSCFYRIGELVTINEETDGGGRIISNGSEWIVIVPQVRRAASLCHASRCTRCLTRLICSPHSGPHRARRGYGSACAATTWHAPMEQLNFVFQSQRCNLSRNSYISVWHQRDGRRVV